MTCDFKLFSLQAFGPAALGHSVLSQVYVAKAKAGKQETWRDQDCSEAGPQRLTLLPLEPAPKGCTASLYSRMLGVQIFNTSYRREC